MIVSSVVNPSTYSVQITSAQPKAEQGADFLSAVSSVVQKEDIKDTVQLSSVTVKQIIRPDPINALYNAYDIHANLDITTARPNMYETSGCYKSGSFESFDGKRRISGTESIKNIFAQEWNTPMDGMLDDHYKEVMKLNADITAKEAILDDLRAELKTKQDQPMTGETEAVLEGLENKISDQEKRVQIVTDNLNVRLGMMQEDYEYHHMTDYAHEVFFKRSEKETGTGIDLKLLMQEYCPPRDRPRIVVAKLTAADEAYLENNEGINRYMDEPLHASSQAFDHQKNLDISTPRPDITDTYEFSIGGWIRLCGPSNTGDAEEMKQRSLKYNGHPLDNMIDDIYGDIKSALNIANGPAADEIGKASEVLLISELHSLQTIIETHDIGDYAREAIFQRSSIEDGKAIDIAALLKQYDMMGEEYFTDLKPLSLPSSPKLEAFAERLVTERAALAAAQSEASHAEAERNAAKKSTELASFMALHYPELQKRELTPGTDTEIAEIPGLLASFQSARFTAYTKQLGQHGLLLELEQTLLSESVSVTV